MLNACPKSADWEIFILNPALAREGMTEHLALCPYCQVTVAVLRSLWKELAASAASSPAHFFVLSAIEEAIPITPPQTLAAKGAEPPPSPRGLTLASTDRVMWLKAVRDAHNGDVWLYLYSEEETCVPRNAVVRPFGLDREYVADEQGRVNLGVVDWPAREQWRAEVKLPRAIFRLQEIGDLDRPAGEATLNSPAGDRLHVRWTADAHGRHITLEVQALTGWDPTAPLQIAVRAAGVDQPVLIRSAALATPLTVEPDAALERIEIFVYH